MSVNKDIYDRSINHVNHVRKFENGMQVTQVRSLNKHRERVKKELQRNINSDLKPEVRRWIQLSYDTNSTSLKELARAESDFALSNLHKSVKDIYYVKSPMPYDLFKVLDEPLVDGKTVLQSYNNLGIGHLKRIESKIAEGLRKGKPHRVIIKEVTKMNLTEAQATALVTTSVTHVQNRASNEVYKANKEILDGYEFVAVLDSKTSQICSHNDGKIFPLDDYAHMPPLHYRCRSTTTPIVKKFDDLKQERTVNKSTLVALADSIKKKFDGKSPPTEDYHTWLTKQPQDIKLKHLGDEEKVKLFDAGNLKVSDFSNAKGESITTEALRRLDNALTSLLPFRAIAKTDKEIQALRIGAVNPTQLIRNKQYRDELLTLLKSDANDGKSTLSLTEYRGALLSTKRKNKYAANNDISENSSFFDIFTGEKKSKYLYDPDSGLLDDRLNLVKQSKSLTQFQKDFIKDFTLELEGYVSTNQQSVIVDNLRILFERYVVNPEPWLDFASVLRTEMQNSVVNVSKRLEARVRDRNTVFGAFSAKEIAEVQILGNFESFDSIANNLRKTRLAIDEWELNTAPKIARGVLFSRGGTPLRTFFAPPKKTSKAPTFLERLQNKFKLPTPIEDFNSFVKELKEDIRGFLILEREYEAKKSLQEKLVSAVLPYDKQVDMYAKAIRLIADGSSTDYDSLAVAIGKMWRENYKPILPFWKPTITDYRNDGALFLNALIKDKKIRALTKGVQRRGIKDLDTGRSSGAFFEVNSRQIEILDKDMIEYQRLLRREVIGDRIGYIDKASRYHVVEGETKYRDAFGNRTSKSVVTRNASKTYESQVIDKDFRDMLNHTMGFEYSVDDDFADFMLRLAHFRDVRGNAAKWDELNIFKKLIIQRGEEGFGLLQTVKWHLSHKKPFTVAAQVDSRGRVYYTGYLHPGGGEVVRPFLNTAKPEIMGQNGYLELAAQTGALLGPPTEALTTAGRLAIFDRNHKSLVELGNIIRSTTQKDRRIREFLEHPLMVDLDAEEVPKLARLALEVARVDQFVGGQYTPTALRRLDAYRTSLAVENDASSSGAQIIALSTRNKALAELSNVVPTRAKQRLYDVIAMKTISDPRWADIQAKGVDLTWKELASAIKYQNMVAFYGAGKNTQVATLKVWLAKVFAKQDNILIIPKEDLKDIIALIDAKIAIAKENEALIVAQELNNFKKEITLVVNGERSYSSTLMREAEEVHPDVSAFVQKLNNTHNKIIGPQIFQDIATIASDHLSREAPITNEFISFWKDVARSYIRNTGSTQIPWVTFDGKIMYQNYRTSVEHRIDYIDKLTGRRISNIVQVAPETDALLGAASEIHARSGLGVNGNHANDATLVRQFHLWGKKNNIDTATIHDAFFTNVAHSHKIKPEMQKLFAQALESDTIRNTLKEMKKRGLPNSEYKRLLKEAEDRGLLDGGLTKQDILRVMESNEEFYGIGP